MKFKFFSLITAFIILLTCFIGTASADEVKKSAAEETVTEEEANPSRSRRRRKPTGNAPREQKEVQTPKAEKQEKLKQRPPAPCRIPGTDNRRVSAHPGNSAQGLCKNPVHPLRQTGSPASQSGKRGFFYTIRLV